jgi:hypothetical protein
MTGDISASLADPPKESDGTECKLARFPPSLFVDALGPYEAVYKAIQGILFWRRPIAMAVTLCTVELLFTMVHVWNLGFVSVATLALSSYYALALVFKIVGSGIITWAFPPINEGEPPTSNRIYPLLPFCQRISHISSTVADAVERMHEANGRGSIQSLFVSSSVFAGLFVFFALCGAFWPAFIIVHILLLAPGIVMHPRVFPYTQPYILRFAEAIKCPYCHAE